MALVDVGMSGVICSDRAIPVSLRLAFMWFVRQFLDPRGRVERSWENVCQPSVRRGVSQLRCQAEVPEEIICESCSPELKIS